MNRSVTGVSIRAQLLGLGARLGFRPVRAVREHVPSGRYDEPLTAGNYSNSHETHLRLGILLVLGWLLAAAGFVGRFPYLGAISGMAMAALAVHIVAAYSVCGNNETSLTI